jgi:hypothetical protein
VRKEELAAGQGVLAGTSPRLIILIKAQLDAGITDTIPFDFIG